MFRVKVCGMRRREDIDVCAAAGADALGFIFAASAKHLSLDEAATLTSYVPQHITCVGVFADNDAPFVQEALRRCRLDLLQFTGDELPEFRGAFGKPTIFVLHVEAAAGQQRFALPDIDALRAANATALMVDSRSGARIGGTGIRVDAASAALVAARSPLPFILAGGLTPDNVAAAVAAVQPFGVDVRSGVERDRSLVEGFVREARRSLAAFDANEFAPLHLEDRNERTR